MFWRYPVECYLELLRNLYDHVTTFYVREAWEIANLDTGSLHTQREPDKALC